MPSIKELKEEVKKKDEHIDKLKLGLKRGKEKNIRLGKVIQEREAKIRELNSYLQHIKQRNLRKLKYKDMILSVWNETMKESLDKLDIFSVKGRKFVNFIIYKLADRNMLSYGQAKKIKYAIGCETQQEKESLIAGIDKEVKKYKEEI